MSVEFCSSPIVKKTELDFRAEFYRRHYVRYISEGLTAQQSATEIHAKISEDLSRLFIERFLKEKLAHYQYILDREDSSLVTPAYSDRDVIENYLDGVFEREKEALPRTREDAELLGAVRFRSEIMDAQGPKVFVLISPPPPDDELPYYPGYEKEKSFIFFGRYDPLTGQTDMFAWRNQKTLEEQTSEMRNLLLRFPPKFEYETREFFPQEGQKWAKKAHPYAFLKVPIFADGGDLSIFSTAVVDMPTEEEFEEVKNDDYSKYKAGMEYYIDMLTTLVANGADDDTLLKAQLQIEMDFTKWIVDGVVEDSKITSIYLHPNYRAEFSSQVSSNFAKFAALYKDKVSNFACGSCGGSVLSMFNSQSSINVSGLSLLYSSSLLAPERWVTCVCGVSVKVGSLKCGSCERTKADFDSEKVREAA